jgi:hypothetical protein
VPAMHGPFDQYFRVLDFRSGRPIANTPYRVRLSGGPELLGVTDHLARYMDSPCVASGVFAFGFRIGLQTIYPASDASVDAGPDDIRSQRPH